MRIKCLKITTFRNLNTLTWEIPAVKGGQIIALLGENGSGKTSVLEALSLLSPGRGLHKARPEEMVQHNAKSWGIHVELTDKTTIGQTFGQKKRLLKLDGDEMAKQAALAGIGSVLWLTPQQDRLFLDGAAARRDFLDRLVYGLLPSHAENLSRYKHHARARLRLLKQDADSDWITLEEQQASEAGVIVLKNRLKYLKALTEHIEEVSINLTGATLRIFEEENPIAALAGKFERSRTRDAEIGATHTGPQKVDVIGMLKLSNGDVNMKQCSSGQHKRGLLQLVLGHARLLADAHKAPPLVLIDEVAAHLDTSKRGSLLQALARLGAQVWVTETEAERLGDLGNMEVTFKEMTEGFLV